MIKASSVGPWREHENTPCASPAPSGWAAPCGNGQKDSARGKKRRWLREKRGFIVLLMSRGRCKPGKVRAPRATPPSVAARPPPQAAAPAPRRSRKSSYALINRRHSWGPLIFWSFDIFELLPFPSLSFLPCHKRPKCLNNWGQGYLLAVSPRHKECRERVRRQILSFFFFLFLK